MTIRSLVAIGLRLFAIWLCFGAFQAFGLSVLARRFGSGNPNETMIGVFVVVFFVAFAVALWMVCEPIANGILAGFSKTEPVKLSAHDLVVVGCVLMGLWWLKESLLPLIWLWLRGLAMSSATTDQSVLQTLSVANKIDAGVRLAQILIALTFIGRPQWIASMVLRQPVTETASANQDSA